MATVGGDITEISVKHPTIGSFTLYPKANEGNTFDPGGIRNNDDASSIAGNGDLVVSKNRVRGHFEVLLASDLNQREDILKIKELAADPVPAEWTFSLINGSVWAGSGIPVGDLSADINAATFTLKVASAEFKKIAG